jgi:hypothetical protein
VSGYLGNVEPLAILAPGTWTTDSSLRKSIHVHESMQFQFTADMFNIFNRTNLAPPALINVFNAGVTQANFNPNTSINTTAGQITKTLSSSRQMQFGIRFEF